MTYTLEDVSARRIALSGLRAQRVRMDLIANNIANAETTRTPGGGAFRRQLAIFRGTEIGAGSGLGEPGVRIKEVVEDRSPFREVYEPSHPDANTDGYVQYPNVQIAVEMANLVAAQRAYEANITVMVSGSRMQEAALGILQR